MAMEQLKLLMKNSITTCYCRKKLKRKIKNIDNTKKIILKKKKRDKKKITILSELDLNYLQTKRINVNVNRQINSAFLL